jgi:hypothetical protein
MRKNFIDVLLELPVDATLQQLLTDHGLPVPLGFAWEDSPDTSRALLECVRQWQDIPAKDQLVGELTACLPLADAPGQQAIFQAAATDGRALAGLATCKSDLHRAFWLYRHRPALFGHALDADFIERRGSQAQQHALSIMRHPNTTQSALAAFNQGVAKFYQRKLLCGDGVESTIFQRSPGVFLLTIHVKDLATMHLEFQGQSLTRRVGNPSIHGMLEYSERTGVVRTLIRGGAVFHQMLAGEFATHLLGQAVDAKRIKPEKLDLTQFRAGVDFPQAVKDGFVAVQLKHIAVLSPTGKLKAECTAMAAAQHQSVTEIMQEELPAPLEGGWSVSAVQINLYYPSETGGRLRVVTAELTSMGRLRLPMRDPVMKANVERYLVEKGILARSQTLEAEEFRQEVDDVPQSLVEA